MKPSLALQSNRAAIHRVIESHRTFNPRVFGSVLHGKDLEDSDLDLLVDTLPGTTLLDLGAIQVELEEMLGVPVEILTPSDLPIKFREQVLREAVPI